MLLLGGLGAQGWSTPLQTLGTGLGWKTGPAGYFAKRAQPHPYVLPGQTRRYPKEAFFLPSVFPLEGRAEACMSEALSMELTDAVPYDGITLWGQQMSMPPAPDCITISGTQRTMLRCW